MEEVCIILQISYTVTKSMMFRGGGGGSGGIGVED
jgi:hypothetical protein